MVKDQYKQLRPDSAEQPGVPKGKLEKFTWDQRKRQGGVPVSLESVLQYARAQQP